MAVLTVEELGPCSMYCTRAWILLVKFVRHDISWMFWINSMYKTLCRKILYPSVLNCY